MSVANIEESQVSNYSFNYSCSFSDERIFCLEVINDHLGVSFFDCRISTLKVLPQDFILTITTNTRQTGTSYTGKYVEEINLIVGALLDEKLPDYCLISSRLEEGCVQYLQDKCQHLNCRLEIKSNQFFKRNASIDLQDFQFDNGLNILQNIKLQEKTSAKATSASLNCLLSLYRQSLDSYNEEDDVNIMSNSPISNVTTIDLNNRMILDDDTLSSLQIFSPLQKVKSVKSNKNEYNNLFELLNHTSSSYSKKLLKSWLRTPLTDIQQISNRLLTIEMLLEPQNNLLFEELRGFISHFPDIFSIIYQFQGGKETYRTWINLFNFLENGHSLLKIIKAIKNTNDENTINQIKSKISISKIKDLLDKLLRIIDIGETLERKKVVILNGIDQQYDELSSNYDHIEKILLKVANSSEEKLISLLSDKKCDFIQKNPKEELVNALYLPEIGYIISINIIIENYFSAFESLNWIETFRSERHIYFKNPQVIELDERFGNIYSFLCDIEIEILYKLKKEILTSGVFLCAYFELVAELDILQSFAYVARANNYTKPELLEEESILDIKEGRHPLLETITNSYIPNDILMEGGNFSETNWVENNFERINILTGANASGKTVFMTQIGMICYMSQIGCFVPAKSAKIGIVDKILTRVRTEETISKLQSSFELDSRQMAKALAFCTEKSLLLIDEFGKGTGVTDGPALFGSIILNLSKNPRCPRVIACTHFNELFKLNIVPENLPGVCYSTTEILLNAEQDHIGDKKENNAENLGITFLFHVVRGISKDSFGIYCASLCGIKKEIIKRANELTILMESGGNLEELCSKISDKEFENFKRYQRIVKAFLLWDLDLEKDTDLGELREKLKDILEVTVNDS